MSFLEKKMLSCHSNSWIEPPQRPNLAELHLLFIVKTIHLIKKEENHLFCTYYVLCTLCNFLNNHKNPTIISK